MHYHNRKVDIWDLEECPLFRVFFYYVLYSECPLSEVPLYAYVTYGYIVMPFPAAFGCACM